MKNIFYSKNIYFQNKIQEGNLVVENDKIIDFIKGKKIENAFFIKKII